MKTELETLKSNIAQLQTKVDQLLSNNSSLTFTQCITGTTTSIFGSIKNGQTYSFKRRIIILPTSTGGSNGCSCSIFYGGNVKDITCKLNGLDIANRIEDNTIVLPLNQIIDLETTATGSKDSSTITYIPHFDVTKCLVFYLD